jgi:RNA polymerase sigma-70 factor (ECF subfamily)
MTDFEQLYARYAKDVYRFALYLSGSPAQAEDITSETFVRVFTSRDKIRTATVKAYLFAIVRNLHTDGRRWAKRGLELPAEIPDRSPGPHLQAESRESLRIVLEALRALPEVDRAALLMRAQDGMPYEEIAAALGLSLAATKVKVHRARLRIAALVTEQKETQKEKVRNPS